MSGSVSYTHLDVYKRQVQKCVVAYFLLQKTFVRKPGEGWRGSTEEKQLRETPNPLDKREKEG